MAVGAHLCNIELRQTTLIVERMKRNKIDKYLSGEGDPVERQEVEEWYEQYEAVEKEIYDGDPEAMNSAADRVFARVHSQITKESTRPGPAWVDESGSRRMQSASAFRLFRRVSAAAVLIAVLIGVYWYSVVSDGGMLLADDVAPGTDQAILKLADGRSIALEDIEEGVLLVESGIRIRKTGEGELVYEVMSAPEAVSNTHVGDEVRYNTIVTPRGGRFQIALPDGSRVWLNAASSLKYPVQFAGGIRQVELQGEGYFDVAKSVEPFVVRAGDQCIEVLGTQFNINAYADEDGTRTTLLTGSVRVSCIGDSQDRLDLLPGQTACSDTRNGAGLRLVPVDAEAIVSWKDDYFYFKEEHISSIMRQLDRWYDIDVVYEDGLSTDALYFSGSVSRDKNLSQVLRVMEATGTVKFAIKGRRVTIMK